MQNEKKLRFCAPFSAIAPECYIIRNLSELQPFHSPKELFCLR